jgi:hypothetical protein
MLRVPTISVLKFSAERILHRGGSMNHLLLIALPISLLASPISAIAVDPASLPDIEKTS